MQLQRGDHNTNVSYWQAFLITQGYNNVVADSHFGPNTERATRSFQEANGLRGDGIVGPNTVATAKGKGFIGFAGTSSNGIEKDAKLILVSAGHTNVKGQDRGAAGNGFVEGDEAVTLRDHVAALLREKGLSVLEDGADGISEPLTRAIVLARKADIAIELHWNASTNPSATGVEVLSKPDKRDLARKLAKAIQTATGIVPRGGDGGWKSDKSGQHHRLGFCEAGGLIVEVCFISNAADMRRYEEGFEQVCVGLADVLAAA